MMAGYSGRPLVGKIGLKEGSRLLLIGAPPEFDAELGPLPSGARLVRTRSTDLDCVMLFAARAADLRKIERAAARLQPAGMLWIAWPKKASGVATDVTDALVRSAGLAAGLVDIKVCAVNEVWSGLKFVWPLKDRPAIASRRSRESRRAR